MSQRVNLPAEGGAAALPPTDARVAYEPPRVVALGSLHEVLGAGGTIEEFDGDQNFRPSGGG